MTIPYDILVSKALEVQQHSYSPYSGFSVGAALLGGNGTIYTGTNIENVAFSPTNCGERSAFFTAVSQGVRDFRAIAIVGSGKDTPTEYCSPCGVCLQVMQEFCNPDTFEIILVKSKSEYRCHTLKEMLPFAFSDF